MHTYTRQLLSIPSTILPPSLFPTPLQPNSQPLLSPGPAEASYALSLSLSVYTYIYI